MAVLNRFSSFLDRFDEQLMVNGERAKHEFDEWIDQRVTQVRVEVAKIKARFDGIRPVNGKRDENSMRFDDDPQVVSVLFEEFMEQQANLLRDGNGAYLSQPSTWTSSGHKRKSANQTGGKQKKARSTGNSNQHECKFYGCGKSFLKDAQLAEHERIHMKIKPFSCTWVNCAYASEQRPKVVRHIRVKHLCLPQTLKEQRRLNIVDDRDPNEFVQVDDGLIQRRLE